MISKKTKTRSKECHASHPEYIFLSFKNFFSIAFPSWNIYRGKSAIKYQILKIISPSILVYGNSGDIFRLVTIIAIRKFLFLLFSMKFIIAQTPPKNHPVGWFFGDSVWKRN